MTKDNLISFRVSNDELIKIKSNSKRDKRNLSDYIRLQVIKEKNEQ